MYQTDRLFPEANHNLGLGETPRRLIRKLEKFEDAFDATVHLSFAVYIAPFPSYSLFLHFGPVLRTFL